MITFFGDSLRYGRFPFEKYGMDAVYPFQWGGMENQTMTMVHEYWVLYGDDNGISHEMSHQWWGDRTTCLDWRNIWLNEGFATNSADLYLYHQQGRSAFITQIQDEATEYFNEEASDPRPVYDPPYPDHLFDVGHTYDKGAWVQHMLRYVEGDTIWSQPGIFFQAMRAYGDSFKYSNASTADYERIHERMTGLDLSWFFNEWIYDMWYPVYTLGWHGRQNGSNWEVVLNLTQNNHSGGPAVFHMPVEVKVAWSGGSQTFRYPVTTSPQENVFSVPAQPTGVVFDPNEWILDQDNTTVDVAEGPQAVLALRLAVAGPNPVTGTARLACEVPAARNARLEVYDGAGRLVRNLAGLSTGRQTVTWDRTDASGRRVAAGAYFVRLTAGSDTRTARLLLAD
jgi:aminopeptidase N